MKQFLLRRLWHAVLVLVGISVIVFGMMHLSGDPAALLIPLDATVEDVAEIRARMGFDDPLYDLFAAHARTREDHIPHNFACKNSFDHSGHQTSLRRSEHGCGVHAFSWEHPTDTVSFK